MEQRLQPAVSVAAASEDLLLLRRPKRATRRWRLVVWAGLLALACAVGSQLKGPLVSFLHSGDAYLFSAGDLMTSHPDGEDDEDPRAKRIDPTRSSYP